MSIKTKLKRVVDNDAKMHAKSDNDICQMYFFERAVGDLSESDNHMIKGVGVKIQMESILNRYLEYCQAVRALDFCDMTGYEQLRAELDEFLFERMTLPLAQEAIADIWDVITTTYKRKQFQNDELMSHAIQISKNRKSVYPYRDFVEEVRAMGLI